MRSRGPYVGMGHSTNVGRLAPEVEGEPAGGFVRHPVIYGGWNCWTVCEAIP